VPQGEVLEFKPWYCKMEKKKKEWEKKNFLGGVRVLGTER
jgi:hypothetical protein